MNALILVAVAAVGLLFSRNTGDLNLNAFTRFDSLFKKYGRAHGVPWRWLKAIAMNESSLGENALVKAGLPSSDFKSYGIMQVTLATAQDLDRAATPAMLNNPEYSVRLAAVYVSRLMAMFSGDRRKVVMSYNQGPGNTKRGAEYAAEYYSRFERNLGRVMQLQPGNELELS